MSRWIAMTLAALLPWLAAAEEAIIQTRDGQTVEGVIGLRQDVLTVINADRGLLTEIAATNLLSALFKPRPPDPYLPELYAAQAEREDELWENQDIGWKVAPGTESTFFGLRRTYCTGTNIAGISDSFHFTYQPIRGDRELVVRVIRVPRGEFSRAGLMIRESLRPDARHIFVGVNAGGGGVFQYRETPAAQSEDFQRPDLFVPHWLKLKREGDHITAYRSSNGQRWTLIQELDLPLPDELFAGLAVTGIEANRYGGREFAMCDNLQTGVSLPANPFRPIVRLQSGTTLVGRIRGATQSELSFMGPLPKASVPLTALSRVDFQWVPYRYSSFLNEARAGVLLANGDFIEGEVKAIQDQRVVLSSVLMGVRSYHLNQDVLSVVLRPPARKSHAFEITTVDGSRWLATDLQFARDELVLHDTALGAWRLPIYDLAEIRRSPFQRSTATFAQR